MALRNLRLSSQNSFTLSLFKSLGSDLSAYQSAKNLCLCPLAIHGLLGIVAEGAVGSSRERLAEFLGVSPSRAELAALRLEVLRHLLADGYQAGGPRLTSTNQVWHHKDVQFKDQFVKKLRSMGPVVSSNFNKNALKVGHEIKAYMKRGNVSAYHNEYFPDPLSRIVLASTIYFKGQWMSTFDRSLTCIGDFTLPDGKKVRVPYMTSRGNQFVSEYPDFKVLRLPYRSGEDLRRFSLSIVLPQGDIDLVSLESDITSDPGFIDGHIPPLRVQMGDFKVPKFSLCYSIDASEALQDMGLDFLFEEGGVDLKGMAETLNNDTIKLYVPQVF